MSSQLPAPIRLAQPEPDGWPPYRLAHITYPGAGQTAGQTEDLVPDASAVFSGDPNGPDELLTGPLRLWPETTMFPFYYRYPVAGRRAGHWVAGACVWRVLAVSWVRRRR